MASAESAMPSSVTCSMSFRPSPATPTRASAPRAVFERDFEAQAVDRRVVAGRDAFGFFVDEEDGDALLIALATGRARGDDERVGPRRTNDDGFVTVQRVACARLLRGDREVGEVVAALRFSEGEREDALAFDEFGDELFLLRLRAAVAEEAAPQHHRAEVGLDHQAAAEFFHDDHGFDRTAAEAAEIFRERCAEQAQLSEGRPVLVVPAAVALRDRAAIVERVVVLHELLHAVAQQRLFFGEGKIHCVVPSVS
jgi:hypothetical protein